MDKQLILSSSPQWRDRESIPRIMNTVTITLIPALALSIWFYGWPAVYLTMLAMLTAVGAEYAIQKFCGLPITIRDGSALLTGLLLAFNLPPGVPFWMPIIGSIVAVGIGKQVFGGLGNNPLNPALIGRAFLMASWPVYMTSAWLPPRGGSLSSIISDNPVLTGATPLNLYKTQMEVLANSESSAEGIRIAQDAVTGLFTNWPKLLSGQIGGSLGETSAIAIFIGALYLLYRNYIDWRIPFPYIFTVGFLGWMFGGFNGLFSGDLLFYILSGGLFLGAFYMATDMVTSPITKKGKIIYSIGCGLLTFIIRKFGG